MLANQRYNIITTEINTNKQASVTALATLLSVSNETIRRDITYLDKLGLVKKVHGGAVSISLIREENYATRTLQGSDVRKLIGKYTSQFIKDGDTIALDSGVTTDELARAIYNVSNIKIITSSISALNILMEKNFCGDFSGEIIFIGGSVNAENQSVTGSMAERMWENFSVDKAFLAATALDINGIYSYNISDSYMTKHLLKCCTESFLLVSSEKFNNKSFNKVCKTNEVMNIITEKLDNISNIAQYKKLGIVIHNVE